jgi:hypothetical protein
LTSKFTTYLKVVDLQSLFHQVLFTNPMLDYLHVFLHFSRYITFIMCVCECLTIKSNQQKRCVWYIWGIQQAKMCSPSTKQICWSDSEWSILSTGGCLFVEYTERARNGSKKVSSLFKLLSPQWKSMTEMQNTRLATTDIYNIGHDLCKIEIHSSTIYAPASTPKPFLICCSSSFIHIECCFLKI